MSLEPFNKTFKMSSPSDSSPCTSESDLESFTVDEVMGAELSEFAPYDDSCEPLATEEEAADYNERVHREEEEEGGVRVCGDAVLRYFWCGFAVIFILSRGIAVSKH